MKINDDCLHILNRFGFGPKLSWLSSKEKSRLLEDKDFLINWITQSNEGFVESRNIEVEQRFSDKKWQERWPLATMRCKWVQRMIELENPIEEKIALFWNHAIPVSVNIWGFAQDVLMDAFRNNATSDYNQLLKEVLYSPCSLKFLNAYHSHKNAPNQNMPRELLELFTVGIDNYTQKDVIELSRCFTGLRTISPYAGEPFPFENIPYPYKMYIDDGAQDRGEKTILGQTGRFDSDEAIDILVSDINTHVNIAKKFMMFFVSDNPLRKHIQELSQLTYSKGKINISDLIAHTLSSNWFYDDQYKRNKVKTPVEFWVGLFRHTGLKTETMELHSNALRMLGQNVFFPENVGGWPWGKSWFRGINLFNRIAIPRVLISISHDEEQTSEMSLFEKVKYRTTHRSLLGFRYEYAVVFNEDDFLNIIGPSNKILAQWLGTSNNHYNNILQHLSSTEYQYN